MTLDFQSYLADIYEQSEHIMEAAGRMTYEEFLGDALYSAGIIRFFEIIARQRSISRMISGMNTPKYPGGR